MKKANVYIDGNYLIAKIENNSKEIDWNGYKLSLFEKVAQELHLDSGELLLENAFLFLTKNEKEKLNKNILASIDSSYITTIVDKYSESADSIETAITWQICKNYYKNPYDICILITEKKYTTLLEKLKDINVSTYIARLP